MNKGFTLLETVIATGIAAIAIVIVGGFMFQGYTTWRFLNEQNEAVSEAKKGLKSMVSELREISTADTGAYMMDTADAQNIIFYRDIDADGAVEQVRYYLSGTNFIKETINPGGSPLSYNPASTTSVIISRYVRNGATPVFIYYDGDYPTDQTPLGYSAIVTQVKLVRMYLEINVNEALAPDSVKVESDVQLRNLKTNL